ncbi:unnamed protein product [Prorocentrum cordatum]|uniref:Centrosomal protein of 70 kDa n=1 Tax=Prorocentrum cordatum TaxID=2364126 RepID=A0ABN9XI63_9DINO|nr:unnamed protein product [Polarella glacialis]
MGEVVRPASEDGAPAHTAEMVEAALDSLKRAREERAQCRRVLEAASLSTRQLEASVAGWTAQLQAAHDSLRRAAEGSARSLRLLGEAACSTRQLQARLSERTAELEAAQDALRRAAAQRARSQRLLEEAQAAPAAQNRHDREPARPQEERHESEHPRGERQLRMHVDRLCQPPPVAAPSAGALSAAETLEDVMQRCAKQARDEQHADDESGCSTAAGGPSWEVADWLASLDLMDIIASVLARPVRQEPQLQLRYMCNLGREPRLQEVVRSVVRDVQCDLADSVADRARELSAARAAGGDEVVRGVARARAKRGADRGASRAGARGSPAGRGGALLAGVLGRISDAAEARGGCSERAQRRLGLARRSDVR